ncbi:MAG TPA: phosphatase PAP2 family protein [Sedimentisphaerales bacterium]|nr:phosphatase PAP2 family protein [Sedimentisphaerales bacterium]
MRKQTDMALLLAVLVLLLTVLGFIIVADEVRDFGKSQGFDNWMIHALRTSDDPADPIGPNWLEETARDMTALGGALILTLLTAAVVGYLWQAGQRRAMLFVLGATVGALLISLLLKDIFDRPRPELVPPLSKMTTTSFPSGHSMVSAAVYLSLGAMLARSAQDKKLKACFVGIALLLTFLVGLSRVYLGVHYPTDVLAGWLAGIGWAIFCWLAVHRIEKRDIPPITSRRQ